MIFSDSNIENLIDTIDLSQITEIYNNTHENKYKYSSCFIYEKYLYLIPEYTGLLLKIDLNNFTTNGVEVLDLSETNTNLEGFTGGCTDGKWIYLSPKK